MKIAINCTFFQPQAGGIREYIHNLVENLADHCIGGQDEFILYVASDFEEYARREWQGLPSNFRIKAIPFRGKGLFGRIYRSLFSSWYWRREEAVEGWDLFHSPFFHSPRGLRSRVILTVHDLRLERYPESYAPLRRIFLRRAVRRSVRDADAIIAVSDFTRSELIRAYQGDSGEFDPSKIVVIHEGLSAPTDGTHLASNSGESHNPEVGEVLKGRYILSVGHLEPRKNYRRLIEAFDKACALLRDDDMHLVIVGRRGHAYKTLLKKIRAHRRVTWLDFVAPGDLQALYRRAQLLVFPSCYEGFGFPPLEAARERTVAVVSNASSMPEICGEGALYFNPFDIEDMAAMIARALSEPHLRHHLSHRMQSRLSAFSWPRAARLTLDLYHQKY